MFLVLYTPNILGLYLAPIYVENGGPVYPSITFRTMATRAIQMPHRWHGQKCHCYQALPKMCGLALTAKCAFLLCFVMGELVSDLK